MEQNKVLCRSPQIRLGRKAPSIVSGASGVRGLTERSGLMRVNLLSWPIERDSVSPLQRLFTATCQVGVFAPGIQDTS